MTNGKLSFEPKDKSKEKLDKELEEFQALEQFPEKNLFLANQAEYIKISYELDRMSLTKRVIFLHQNTVEMANLMQKNELLRVKEIAMGAALTIQTAVIIWLLVR